MRTFELNNKAHLPLLYYLFNYLKIICFETAKTKKKQNIFFGVPKKSQSFTRFTKFTNESVESLKGLITLQKIELTDSHWKSKWRYSGSNVWYYLRILFIRLSSKITHIKILHYYRTYYRMRVGDLVCYNMKIWNSIEKHYIDIWQLQHNQEYEPIQILIHFKSTLMHIVLDQ